jgi:uncharacterized protein YacL (UPF0231 family)
MHYFRVDLEANMLLNISLIHHVNTKQIKETIRERQKRLDHILTKVSKQKKETVESKAITAPQTMF